MSRKNTLPLAGFTVTFTVVAEAGNGREALQVYRQIKPEVVLMDLRLPEVGGVEATMSIRKEFPDARVIILTTFDMDEDIYRAIQGGAKSYLLKARQLWSLKYPPCPTPADAKQPQIRAQRPHQAPMGPKGGFGSPSRFSRLQIALRGRKGGNRSPPAPPPWRPKPTRISTTARRAPPNKWPDKSDTRDASRGFFLLANLAGPLN